MMRRPRLMRFEWALVAAMLIGSAAAKESSAQMPQLMPGVSTAFWGCPWSTPYAGWMLLLPDIDGDGGSEIAFSIPYFFNNPCGTSVDYSGRIEVRSSANMSLIYSLSGVPGSTQALGSPLVLVDDVDGDGREDFCTTTQQSPGLVQELQFRSSASGAIVWTIPYPFNNGAFVPSVLGDVDNDGVKDLAVLLPGYAVAQRIEVRSGATGTLLSMTNPPPGSSFLGLMTAVGDVSGDGLGDLIVTTYGGPANGGWGIAAYAYAPNVLSQLYIVNGASTPPLPLPRGIAAVGDVNSDSIGDFISVDNSTAGQQPGQSNPVLIRSGSTGQAIRSLVPPPVTNNSLFGSLVAGVGDIDGDGYDDIAVAAPLYMYNSSTGPRGSVFVYSGATGAMLFEAVGPQPVSWVNYPAYPSSIAGHGDVNGDGYGDLVLSDDNASTGNDSVTVYYGAPAFSASAAAGTVTNAQGVLVDVLFAEILGSTSGQTSGGLGRALTTSPGSQLAFWLGMPPTHSGTAAHHVLFGRFIDGADFTTSTLPFGLGTMAMTPSLLSGADPSLFLLTSSFDGSGAAPSLPSFSSGVGNPVLATPPIPLPMGFWIQGLVQNDGASGVPLSVTNLMRFVVR